MGLAPEMRCVAVFLYLYWRAVDSLHRDLDGVSRRARARRTRGSKKREDAPFLATTIRFCSREGKGDGMSEWKVSGKFLSTHIGARRL